VSNRRSILIVGLGSVGRRHLANLQLLGWTDVRVLRSGLATLPDADLSGVPVVTRLEEALDPAPLAVVVATPTALHLPIALAAARAGAHLLIEKPVSHNLQGLDALSAEVSQRDLQVLVGYQFRFHPGLQQLKSWIDTGAIGDVVSAQVHWGEYLPDMHPWEDYRGGYAARADLGGGVLLTLCHPFDYLRWLLGEIDAVTAVAARRNPLGVAVDTCADVSLEFASGASGHVHLNFIQRPAEHHITFVGTTGTVTWNQGDHTARLFTAASGQWQASPPPVGFERNSMFLDEMRHFLACIHGDASSRCDLADAIASLLVAHEAREALSWRRDLAVTA
jgi:predicted dehydrogenase